jgi:hypothetical protein
MVVGSLSYDYGSLLEVLVELLEGFLRDGRKSVERISLVVWLWDPHLFLRWASCGFNEHSIFGVRLDRVGWNDFCELRCYGRRGLLTWF